MMMIRLIMTTMYVSRSLLYNAKLLSGLILGSPVLVKMCRCQVPCACRALLCTIIVFPILEMFRVCMWIVVLWYLRGVFWSMRSSIQLMVILWAEFWFCCTPFVFTKTTTLRQSWQRPVVEKIRNMWKRFEQFEAYTMMVMIVMMKMTLVMMMIHRALAV